MSQNVTTETKYLLLWREFGIENYNYLKKCSFLCYFLSFISKIKVRKTPKIRNQSNQVPHLTQDTTWESDKITIRHYKQEPRGKPFPNMWPQGSNEQTPFTRVWRKKSISFVSNNLWLLKFYNLPSQVYWIKSKGRVHKHVKG